MSQDSQPGDLTRITRVIDMKLPLTWLLGVAGIFAATFAGMFFQIGQVSKDLGELKIEVKVGNSQASTVQGELAIMKFRIENLESDKRSRK